MTDWFDFCTVTDRRAVSSSQVSRNESPLSMRYGTVVQYHPARGFGFIRPYFGPDVFFHITALGACKPEPTIEPGQPVKYELIPDTELKPRRAPDPTSAKSDEPTRPQAKLVELIDKLPGADLEKQAEKLKSSRHPRARKKKPTWRR